MLVWFSWIGVRYCWAVCRTPVARPSTVCSSVVPQLCHPPGRGDNLPLPTSQGKPAKRATLHLRFACCSCVSGCTHVLVPHARVCFCTHTRSQRSRAHLDKDASSFCGRGAVKAERGMTGTEGGNAGELCMTQGGEPLSARTKACARQPSSPLYLYLPFARALSPLPACNSAQISEEAGRLIFSVCMAKERGLTLTPDSQLLNPPPRPAEGKGKNLSALASCWSGEGHSDLVAALCPGLHASPPQAGCGLSQQGLACLMCVQFWGGH